MGRKDRLLNIPQPVIIINENTGMRFGGKVVGIKEKEGRRILRIEPGNLPLKKGDGIKLIFFSQEDGKIPRIDAL